MTDYGAHRGVVIVELGIPQLVSLEYPKVGMRSYRKYLWLSSKKV
jgi:hypothetical protein